MGVSLNKAVILARSPIFKILFNLTYNRSGIKGLSEYGTKIIFLSLQGDQILPHVLERLQITVSVKV